jgi:putative lipoic acid-binding regulatory protein
MSPPSLPPIALLEDTHAFPCAYTFKVFGPADVPMAERVERATATALTRAPRVESSCRPSGQGRWLCVTVAVEVHDAHEVHALYYAYLGLEDVRMVL